MGKFAILLCAASTAFATLVFVLPQTLNAGPVHSGRSQATIVIAPELPGMAELFYPEKLVAPRQDLPPQF